MHNVQVNDTLALAFRDIYRRLATVHRREDGMCALRYMFCVVGVVLVQIGLIVRATSLVESKIVLSAWGDVFRNIVQSS